MSIFDGDPPITAGSDTGRALAMIRGTKLKPSNKPIFHPVGVGPTPAANSTCKEVCHREEVREKTYLHWEKIMHFFVLRGSATRTECSRHLNWNKSRMNYHFVQLVEKGLLEPEGKIILKPTGVRLHDVIKIKIRTEA